MQSSTDHSADPLYHYTDTGRLPWILRDGLLRPGRNRIGGFPDPDFLWATTSPLGDRTASASVAAIRSGMARAVRFVLRAEDFVGWPDVVQDHPAWTPEQVARLERAAAGKSHPRDWRCRIDALPAEAWLRIETRAYTDNVWRPIALCEPLVDLDEDTVGVWIGGKAYFSNRLDGPSGSAAYRVFVGARATAA